MQIFPNAGCSHNFSELRIVFQIVGLSEGKSNEPVDLDRGGRSVGMLEHAIRGYEIMLEKSKHLIKLWELPQSEPT